MAMKKVLSLDCEDTHDFDDNKKVKGYYLGSKKVPSDLSKRGFNYLHVLKRKGAPGNVGVWGSAKLDEAIAQVPRGALTAVTYNGKIKIGGGKTLKTFDVEFDDEDILKAAAQVKAAVAEENVVEEDTTEDTDDTVEETVDEDTTEDTDDSDDDMDADEAEALLQQAKALEKKAAKLRSK